MIILLYLSLTACLLSSSYKYLLAATYIQYHSVRWTWVFQDMLFFRGLAGLLAAVTFVYKIDSSTLAPIITFKKEGEGRGKERGRFSRQLLQLFLQYSYTQQPKPTIQEKIQKAPQYFHFFAIYSIMNYFFFNIR